VGKDQVQHVEMARDIAEEFNRQFGETFKLPRYVVDEETAVIPGLDGRKMSKSCNNTIPLFADEEELRRLIMKMKTDSSPPEAPKDPDASAIFTLYKEFAPPDQVEALRSRYRSGIGWGEAKDELFRAMNDFLKGPREKYNEYMAAPETVDRILREGARKARGMAAPFLKRVRRKIGRLA